MSVKLFINNWLKYRLIIIAIFTFSEGLTCFSNSATAQITPDTTLGAEHSIVTTKPNSVNEISGGAKRGTNLFHSFEQFSLPTGSTAYFNNPLDIQNIFSRVTGSSVSNIDGLLRANGTANLFLLNPNGIIFVPNASLNIGGSFIASTANNINFADGTQFSANPPGATPLLTISVPIGLGFTSKPGAIEVQGTGHNLSLPSSLLGTPLLGGGSSTTGLRLEPAKTLALVGGNISFDGGIVTVPDGQIQLGSVGAGEEVEIRPASKGWNIEYTSVKNFQDVKLDRLSLLDVSGFSGGNILIHGNQVALLNSSFILNQSLVGDGNEKISINATQPLLLQGSTSNLGASKLSQNAARIRTAIVSQTISGKGANIDISSKDLSLESGGEIVAYSLQSGFGGHISVNTSDSIKVIGASPIDPVNNVSTILTGSLSSSQSGDIKISTGKLLIQDGASVNSGNAGTAPGGNIFVNATQSVLVSGGIPDVPLPSILSSGTYSSGKAGELVINTPQLTVLNGANINTNTVASGSAGKLFIDAPNLIKVSGFLQSIYSKNTISSSITSGAFELTSSQKQLIGLFPTLTGDSADIRINTKHLIINDRGLISVENYGVGKAGSLNITANSINLDSLGSITSATTNGLGGNINLYLANQLNLDHHSIITATAGGRGNGGNIFIDPQQITISNGSGIAVNSTGTGNAGQLKLFTNNLTLDNGGFLSASTNGGEGGNIFLNAQNLQLRHSSSITASAGDTGSGGNININTGVLTALENSNINANAPGGTGGRVNVNTQGLFRSADSAITAFGQTPQLNGIVQIRDLGIDLRNSLTPLTVSFVSPEQLIANSCLARRNAARGSFVVTGNGGLPITPYSGMSEWETSPEVSPSEGGKVERLRQGQQQATSSSSERTASLPRWKSGDPIVEAQGIIVTADGHKWLGLMPQAAAPQSADKLVCPQLGQNSTSSANIP